MNTYNKVIRPWGWYEDYFRMQNCVFKVLVINPGQSISYQTHKNRDETWFIPSGVATLKISPPGPDQLKNYEISQVGDGALFTVPRGYAHQVINESNKDLIIYEMQTGLQCSEDDIIRLEDPYKR